MGVMSQVEYGCWAMADSFLVLAPRKTCAWYCQYPITLTETSSKYGHSHIICLSFPDA